MTISRCRIGELPASTSSWINRNSLLASEPFLKLWTAMDGLPVYWIAEQDKRIVAVLPGVEFGKGMLIRFQALPDGLYAPLMFPQGTPESPELVAERLFCAVAERGYARWFLNDYYGHFARTGGPGSIAAATLLVEVPGPEWQPPDAKLRSEIRKAEREGVTIEPFSLNRHYEPFLTLMRQTEKRHGRRPKYTDVFYRELGKLSMTDSRVKFSVCAFENELAAAHIYLVEGSLAFNWQVFFDKRFSHLKANQSITHSVACDLARSGPVRLNLGASPADAESLDTYKRKWGAEPFEYQVYSHKKWWCRWL